MDEQKKATLNLKDSAVQYAILAREVDTNKQLYDGVLPRLKEIGVAAEVRSSNIYVMGKALPPGGPSYPDKRRTMMLGLLVGLGRRHRPGVFARAARQHAQNSGRGGALFAPAEPGHGARFRAGQWHEQGLCFAADEIRTSRIAGFGA